MNLHEALRYAVQTDDLQMVKYIFRHWPDINVDYTDEIGETHLFEAIKMGNTKMARFLVKKGASLTIQNVYGQSPLDLKGSIFSKKVVKKKKNDIEREEKRLQKKEEKQQRKSSQDLERE